MEQNDPKRAAIREIKWLANSMKGLLELADALEEPSQLEKEAREIEKRIEALKIEEAKLVDVESQLAVKSAKLAGVEARLAELQRKYG